MSVYAFLVYVYILVLSLCVIERHSRQELRNIEFRYTFVENHCLNDMKSEDRKQLICNYIERNHFSTIREIADNFKNGKSSNYYVVQNDISKLLDDNRIESLSILIGNKQV